MTAKQDYTTSELLHRISTGDEQAFSALVNIYRPRLQGYIAGITKSNEVAEEIVMDVFLKLWTGRDVITEIQNMDGFLFKIAYNFSINFLKKIGGDRKLSDFIWDRPQVSDESLPDQKIIVQEYEAVLREAIELMPPHRRRGLPVKP